MPQSNTFHVQHTDSLVLTLLPCSQNQILPHLLLMLQNMCSAWLLFSPYSPFPGQEQSGLKIHAFEKKATHRNNSKFCFPRGFLQGRNLFAALQITPSSRTGGKQTPYSGICHQELLCSPDQEKTALTVYWDPRYLLNWDIHMCP